MNSVRHAKTRSKNRARIRPIHISLEMGVLCTQRVCILTMKVEWRIVLVNLVVEELKVDPKREFVEGTAEDVVNTKHVTEESPKPGIGIIIGGLCGGCQCSSLH